MKRFSIALLLSTSMVFPVFADEFKFESDVAAVTVFPKGAEVQRVATGSISEGAHTILVENLPANISPDSIRVEGASNAAVTIGSVDVSQVFLSENDTSQRRRELEMQIEALNDEYRRLEQTIADTNLQRSLLEKLISNAGAGGAKDTAGSLTALEVADLLDGAAQRLDQYAQRSIDAQASQRELQRQMISLQNQIAALAPREQKRSVVAINVNADGAGEARFEIRYAVADAGWQPIYDAALKLGDGKAPTLDITRRAQVRQSTAESWENVALTLSTARPSMRTSAPALEPHEIDQIVAQPRKSSKLRSLENSYDELRPSVESESLSDSSVNGAAQAPIAREEVVADFGGFQATYEIPGVVTITNTGQVKSVTIADEGYDVDLYAYTVPRLDPAAYLMASFTVEGSATYLPGAVLLSRDGAYIGRGTMPMLAPGDDFDLSFGQDDFVKVERVETDRKEGEAGLISASLTDERRTKTTITNLHRFPIKVEMLDRLPVANHEDINVEMLPGMTKPTRTDVEDKRGILAWDLDLPAGGDATVDFGYRVSWPKAMEISLLD